ncbi:MAG TPA: dihydrolipoyl dehydrogenase [Rectinema sp.]|jgi:dihydrolipoamide dehydrogenase|nr:dihydrolipoyl dehydrogenase [Spirochaetia bacterium]MDI9428241.1 dihydrolipoyl dehydrogenase [Spirochaetota bacterium]HNT58991.1 dihydrolipoyl dehydrogenase [Rectinema sp.]HOE99249.1 dihydrolipoyl dehydrogenase [Rectinema sp.]HOH16881.1 dihydrolipoyl dehydrogenase [Rectinema sp.]
MKEREFDFIVIGAGPGGYVAAIRAAQLGLKTAVVEKNLVGGVCLNVGCIPSKSLIHNARLFAEGGKMLQKAGAKIDMSGFDYEPIWKTSRLVAEKLSKGVNFLLKKNKVELIQGTAKLTGASTVEVEGADAAIELRSKAILLATGSRPRIIPGFELDEKRILSSTGILMKNTLPKRLFILGAGPIGMEFAYIMNAFGVDVTVVELLPRALPLEDEEVSRIIEKEFRNRGVTIYTGANAKSAEIRNNEVVVHVVDEQTKAMDIYADAALVSVGRTPNTDNLGLEQLGIKTDRGYILTGDYHETSCSGIFAVGDITTYPQLAHAASKAGEIVAERVAHLLKGTPNPQERSLDRLHVPSAVYCDPQVASFGLSEASAKEKCIDHQVARFPYRGNGRAVAEDAPEGQVKLVFDRSNGAILGASIIGEGAADLIHEPLLAANAGLRIDDIAALVHAHPTLSETIMEASKVALDRAIHI